MGTVTITSAGFASGPNGSRVGTLNDADFARFITWAKVQTTPPVTPQSPTDTRTNGQVLTDWIGRQWQSWTDAIQTTERVPASNPNPPVVIS